MSKLPTQIATAGKITVVTSLFGVMVFFVAFLLNLGADELQHAAAQSNATTTITVLNTPPQWTVDAREEVESSTSTPTNSTFDVSWIATGTDSNSAPYFLLICSTAAAPSANAAAGPSFLGTAAPNCDSPANQWAVSTGTISGTQARAATTTLESWAEQNDWYAWICDDDPVNPRCNAAYRQGTSTPQYASPFYVNHRPTFTAFSNDGPKLPGEVVTFTTTASDTDVVTVADTVMLHVCSTASFSTTTGCGALTLATSTLTASNPTGTYTVTIPTQDGVYDAYGYIVDVHDHLASGGSQGTNSQFTVSNATPYVNAGDITLNGTSTMALTVPAGETTGFTLSFIASDNNSCMNLSNNPGSEFSDYVVSVYRTNNSTTTCDASGEYDPNDCYTNSVASTTWNIACTASTTTCTGNTDLNMQYDCTFPLWYVADPTDAATSPFFGTNWAAAAAAVDDDSATGTLQQGNILNDVATFLAIELDTLAIPYGALEPGQQTDPLVASTTLRTVGNTGIDELLTGESMCTTYTSAVTCPNSATSTIAESNQVYATSSVTYATAQGAGYILSSSTQNELEINVPKATTTAALSQPSGTTFWGIAVPIAITLAGAYTGENTFYGKVAEVADW